MQWRWTDFNLSCDGKTACCQSGESVQLVYVSAGARSNQPVWGLQPGCRLCSGLSGATQWEHTVQSSYSTVWRTNWQPSHKTSPNFKLSWMHSLTRINHQICDCNFLNSKVQCRNGNLGLKSFRNSFSIPDFIHWRALTSWLFSCKMSWSQIFKKTNERI